MSKTPKIIDADRDEITAKLDGKELRGWSYKDDAERRKKMQMAHEFAEGWYQAVRSKGHQMSEIHIVFDGPPGPVAGRFVEVETPDGRSIKVGEWRERPDGYWALVLEHTMLEGRP